MCEGGEYLGGTVFGTNPVTGEKLNSKDYGGACNLGSLFLHNFVKKPFTKDAYIDTDSLDWSIKIGVRMLDNVIDINKFPDNIYKNYQDAFRTIGFGVTGFADTLAMLGYRYNTKEAVKYGNDLMNYIVKKVYRASIELAKEKGAFPFFKKDEFVSSIFILKHCDIDKEWKEIYNDIREYGIRNGKLMSVAPTGTISLTYGNNCSSGIEPIFSLSYERKVKIGGQNEENEQIVEMTDYAYGLYKKMVANGECVDFDEKDIFVTAMNMTVDEHVDMLAKIAFHTDMSVSKCVAKGTKIQTNHGIMNIEDMGNARGDDVFGKPLSDLKVKDCNGDWQSVTSHYSGGVKPTKKIKFSNGFVLECSLPHKLMNDKYEWVKAEDLKIGDKILYRTESYDNEYPNINIDTGVCVAPNAKPIILPNKMTDEFALLLGMLVADGSTCLSSGTVGITTASDEIENKFIELVDIVFNRECHIIRDKRTNNTRTVSFNSRAAAKFVRELIGEDCVTKHTPTQILFGTESHMKNFIAGVTLDGYISSAASGICLYEGYSKQLRDEIASMCSYFGTEYHIFQKYVKTGRKLKYAYGIKIYNKDIIHFESSKQLYSETNVKRIPIPDNFEDYKPNTSHSAYSSYRMIHQGLVDSIKEDTANNLGIPNNGFYVLKITSIEDSKNEVYDIEVENTHSYLIDGIISHNTINVPTDYSFEDTKKIYMKCWKLSIKGCTIFRPNEIRKGILYTEDSKKEEQKEETVNTYDTIVPVSRKTIGTTHGKTYCKKTACGTLYITINCDDNNNIVETFVHTSKGGICQANVNAINRMISLNMRSGVKVDEIIDQLRGINCQACAKTISSGIKLDGISCPDIISRTIKEFKESLDGEPAVQKPIKVENTEVKLVEQPQDDNKMSYKAGTCPECGAELEAQGGCVICLECGYSKCE